MIENTFQHLPGFSTLKEKRLWDRNIRSWQDYSKASNEQLSFDFDEAVTILSESESKLHERDANYFAERLPHELSYRVAHTFPEKTLFIDIETTGLSRYYDKITIVGWSVLNQYSVYIDGDEKAREKLFSDLRNVSCIVTFNGSLFDLPFLKIAFPEIVFPPRHVDLRFFSRRVGLQGGQKNIETLLKFKRRKDILDVDGLEATILWHKYKEGNMEALKKLIVYNAYDIDGMKTIFEKITKLYLKQEKSAIDVKSVFQFSKFKSQLAFTARRDEAGIYLPRYAGKIGPKIFLNDLPDVSNYKVVGIDLTGSEKKASGWAYLESDYAHTKTIFTDNELIEETIKLKPVIISIDSPLSIPIGRTTVFDDDPSRKEFGITRECERILAKRGVKSYPCLIQSMQRLTLRGMKLAAEFRKLGFAVIESYPGAAQDILGIPRKKKSREYLIRGLKHFGIDGDYDQEGVTHDEIDAITSALVGHFFLADKFEALGNEQEDYLIIPKVESEKEQARQVVIGLSGQLSTGKTTSGMMLQDWGFDYARYSMVIDTIIKDRGLAINRTNQQKIGAEVNQQGGQRFLGTQLLKLLSRERNIVIDGLRFLEDHSFLREQFGLRFFHIHLQASTEKRRARYDTNPVNNIPFETANAHSVENEIGRLYDFADLVVANDDRVSDLERELKNTVDKLCQYQ